MGNLASVTYPNGVVHAYSYDQRNRLANLAVNKVAGTPVVTTPLLSYAYTLDASGRVAHSSDRILPSQPTARIPLS